MMLCAAALHLVEEEHRCLDQGPPVPHRHRLHDQRHAGAAAAQDEAELFPGGGHQTGHRPGEGGARQARYESHSVHVSKNECDRL